MIGGDLKPISSTIQHPPKVRTCIFWLRNRWQTWRDAPNAADDGIDDIARLEQRRPFRLSAYAQRSPRMQSQRSSAGMTFLPSAAARRR